MLMWKEGEIEGGNMQVEVGRISNYPRKESGRWGNHWKNN